MSESLSVAADVASAKFIVFPVNPMNDRGIKFREKYFHPKWVLQWEQAIMRQLYPGNQLNSSVIRPWYEITSGNVSDIV